MSANVATANNFDNANANANARTNVIEDALATQFEEFMRIPVAERMEALMNHMQRARAESERLGVNAEAVHAYFTILCADIARATAAEIAEMGDDDDEEMGNDDE